MFWQNFVLLCNQKNISPNGVCNELGFSTAIATKWKNGSTPRSTSLQKIADYFGVSTNYLLNNTDIKKEHPAKKGVQIPVLGCVQAGIPIEAIEDIIDYEEIPETMASNGEYFGLMIRGDSMEPKISEGDIVIVRKQDYADNGDIAVVLVNSNDATVKKIKRQQNGIMLVPNNPNFTPMFYSNEDIEKLPVTIIGKVVELRAKF